MGIQELRPAFAHLLPAETFRAWRMVGDAKSRPIQIEASTLDEAVEAAVYSCGHKDHFTVLQTTAAGKLVEHVYYVKQGKPIYVRKPGFAHTVQIKPLEAVLLFSRGLEAFVPVEPWAWSRGADVVGIDRSAPIDALSSGEGV